MFNLVLRAVAALLVASTAAIATTGVASASSPVPPTAVGYDISFPQCGGSLPNGAGFAIVGVNNGHPFSTNPCLTSELQWAQTTQSASPEFYVNTANPGPTSNPNWPTSQQTPQVCAGANSVPCSYDAGWNAGRASFQSVLSVEAQLGASSPPSAATSARWWLDVESGNAWETLRTGTTPTSAAYANDQAVIQGELAYLASVGVASVGIYSTQSLWRGIVGLTGSTFSSVPAWMPGAATLSQAEAQCTWTSFTGGRVAMTQYPSNGLDGDYLCALVSSPTSSTVSVASSATFNEQLTVTSVSLPLTYGESTGQPSLLVSSTGLVSTSGSLAFGTYTTTGVVTTSDNTGTFSFTLQVGLLTQSSPLFEASTSPGSATFSTQLAVSGASGPATFTKTSGATGLVVSPSGLVSTSGALAAGSYVARGTTSDASGDKGTFFFNLRVGFITQSAPERATSTTFLSSTFNDQLVVSGSSGAVTFTQTLGAPGLVVSPSGLVSTSGALAAGSYVARGTTSDASGDKGTFFFNLLVAAPTTINQGSPNLATTTTLSSSTFNDQLVVSKSTGAVTFTQTLGAPALVVSSSGLVSTSGALAAGSYVARGTTSDASGNTGTFFFNLLVSAGATLSQSAPERSVTNTTTSSTFNDQLVVSKSTGAVTFTQTLGAPGLVVSPSGLVSTSGALAAGSYVARGTTSDASGDTGTFFFNLLVSAAAPPVHAVVNPVATRVVGHVVAGRTVSVTILGSGFYGRPRVVSHAGSTAVVTKDTGKALLVRVRVRPGSRNGLFTFTITLQNGKSCTVRYVQR